MYYSNWYGMDTENDKEGKVTLCALASEHGDIDVWEGAGYFRTWCDNNKDESPVVICHNLEYDLVNEFGAYYPYLNLTYLKGRLIMAQYGDVRFLDSFNHYRMPLKKVGEPFGLTKGKFDIHSKEYVSMDAFIPVKAMTFTRDYLLTLGGEIGATAGSSAMSVWMAMTGGEFLTGPFDTPWLRQGYAGGRTEIFRRHTEGELIPIPKDQPIAPKSDPLNNEETNTDDSNSHDKSCPAGFTRKDSILIPVSRSACFPSSQCYVMMILDYRRRKGWQKLQLRCRLICMLVLSSGAMITTGSFTRWAGSKVSGRMMKSDSLNPLDVRSKRSTGLLEATIARGHSTSSFSLFTRRERNQRMPPNGKY